MNDSAPMPLATAERYAVKLCEWLAPHCQRLSVAGSIRRQRPVCRDVDIVCIPKTAEKRDLFGEIVESRNLAFEFLTRYAAEGKATILSGGSRAGDQLLLQLSKCQLDLWFATEATFAARWLCRTGSARHNILFAQRAQTLGLHWNPYIGLQRQEGLAPETIPTPTEADLYRVLRLPYIDPLEREEDSVLKLIRQQS